MLYVILTAAFNCPIHEAYPQKADFKSQFGQDAFVASIFRNKKGVYLDIGCNGSAQMAHLLHLLLFLGKCYIHNEILALNFTDLDTSTRFVCGCTTSLRVLLRLLPVCKS